MAKPPISCCIIHGGDDPHLDATIASVEPHVEQIVVVRSTEVPGAHDDQGRIVDFAAARNRTLELATQPWCFWLDSDDLLAHGDRLDQLCRAPEGTCYLLPYEYSYDQLGRVVTRQYRERLWSRGRMEWKFPVHEVAVATAPGSHFVLCDDVIVRHQRQYYAKPAEPNRNLRILQAWMADHPDDVRNLYYLGLELCSAGDTARGRASLLEYLKRSGWEDERMMACMRLVQLYEAERDYNSALGIAYQSLQTGDWFEAHYAIGRQYYHLKNWERAAYYLELALKRPPTRTPLFVNQQDRDEIHVYYNYTLNQLGRASEGYASVLEGLRGNPTHPFLLKNREVYEKALGVERRLPSLAPLDMNRLKIVFACLPGLERWDPATIRRVGNGGSEIMLAHMARELAKLGHEVTVYADPATPGEQEGAVWRNRADFHDLACDVLVVSRDAFLLREELNVEARVRLLWCHDVWAHRATPELLARADRILALSDWHRDVMLSSGQMHGAGAAKYVVTRNGIDLERFRASPPRDPYRIVNSSSPDRSWPVLLDCFARIREREPRAELHLFYGFENWKKVSAGDAPQMALITSLEKRVREQPGVTFHGRVSQERLADEFLRSGVWAYPTWFSETSCISAMEAQAAGLHVITSNRAALAETARGGWLLDGEWTDTAYQDVFVRTVLDRFSAPTPRYACNFGLPSLAREWETMFRGLLDQRASRPIEPYEPTGPYRSKNLALPGAVSPEAAATPAVKTPGGVKLNIACGPNVFPFPGWVNYDKAAFHDYFRHLREAPLEGMPEHQQAVARYVRTFPDVPVRPGDMTQPGTFAAHADGSVDLIYVGQAIEHLNRRTQAVPFLRECRRMLRVGGVLRMTTPDLRQIVLQAVQDNSLASFAGDQPPWFAGANLWDQLSYLLFGASGPDCTQQNYEGHFHVYASATMRCVLEEAGFTQIAFGCPPRAEIRDEGLSHSMVVEATR